MADSNTRLNFIDPILRDFFVTKDGLIFSVIDYFHPPQGVRSILRYVPDENGTRLQKGTLRKYRKTDFADSFYYLKEHHSDWLSETAIVPRSEILQILKPNDAVFALLFGNSVFPAAAELIQRLDDSGIPASAMGISGSLLPGLDNEDSDIDFVVYGRHWFKAKEAVDKMKRNNETNHFGFKIADLDDAMWRAVYRKRQSPLSFEDFLKHEIRKGNRGMLIPAAGGKNIYFDLLFVRSGDQIQKPISRGIDTHKTEIEAIVTDASFAFDSPAIYLIDHDDIDEIYSYTHTYAGQAEAGETIRARGMVEVIGTKKRLVIGTSREAADEWMMSLTLLEK
jgi:Uncharacterized protein conserved in archaea